MTYLGISTTMFKSAAVGTFSTFMGLGLSMFLDERITKEQSNIAGLLLESIIDFFGQKYVFHAEKSPEEKLASRFFIAKVLAILATQGLFMGSMWLLGDKIGKIGIQIVRLATAIVAFFAITYPLRKDWVFKKKKNKVYPSQEKQESHHSEDKYLLTQITM